MTSILCSLLCSRLSIKRFTGATIVYCRFVFVRQFSGTMQRPNNRHQHPCTIENKHLARPSKFTPSHLRCDLIVRLLLEQEYFRLLVGNDLLALINFAKFATIAIYLSSAIIVYYCLSNIWTVFEPQLCKVLIINDFNILHRQVKYNNGDKLAL